MYQKFESIDGTHPWREACPDGYVDYPAKHKRGGKVIYFNFDLARELGLIPKEHPDKITKKLEETVLNTFSLQIINEYDWVNKKFFPQDHLTDRLYMATRYLQLQHSSRQGETSGDGRSIWNGVIKTRTKMFDVSSCGTGNTILSPGAQETDKPIETGSEEYGYASGLADLDEMLGSAIMSDIFYRQGLPTERCLTVIDYNNGTAIGVRTAPNLIRPAHIYRYLKKGDHKELKAAFDYFLDRQKYNGYLDEKVSGKRKYYKALKDITKTYARLSAVMEEEYIFNWLAWDGDNILAHGAILDYGSIRQFSAKHNKYRYEDVDRYSTCLTEQKLEAKRMIQTFAQAVDFVVTGEKKNLDAFVDSKYLKLFDDRFDKDRLYRMLWRMGFTKSQIKKLMKNHQDKVSDFQKVLNYFEDIKTEEGEEKVADGINHPPIFLVRLILRDLPKFVHDNIVADEYPIMEPEEFCSLMAASYVDKQQLPLND